MKEFTIQLEDEEVKALGGDVGDIQEWLHTVVHQRALKAIDKVVTKYSDKQAGKIAEAEKFQIVRDAKIPVEPKEPILS